MGPTSNLSVTRAVGAAMEHTDRILFSPFDVSKWFILGFSAFLASLGSGGFGGNWANWGGRNEALAQEALDWIRGHLALVIALGILFFLFLLALGLLMGWLAGRGDFMFLDGVVRNRAEVREPWRRFRSLGNRLFVYRFLAGLAVLGLFLVLGLLAAGLFWWTFHRGGVLPWGLVALLGFAFLAVLVGTVLFFQVLHDFAVPVMYRLEVGPSEALALLREEVLPGRGWDLARFYLLKLLMGIGAGILVFIAGCLTCCLGFLPYLSSVLTLPVSVFFRTYSLDLLAQADPQWDLLAGGAEASISATPVEAQE